MIWMARAWNSSLVIITDRRACNLLQRYCYSYNKAIVALSLSIWLNGSILFSGQHPLKAIGSLSWLDGSIVQHSSDTILIQVEISKRSVWWLIFVISPLISAHNHETSDGATTCAPHRYLRTVYGEQIIPLVFERCTPKYTEVAFRGTVGLVNKRVERGLGNFIRAVWWKTSTPRGQLSPINVAPHNIFLWISSLSTLRTLHTASQFWQQKIAIISF